MTPERFRSLLQAYGGDSRRWPPAERAAAEALLAQGAPGCEAALAEARALDGLLSSHTVAPPSAALARHVLAAAGAGARWGANLSRRTRAWWAGAGLVGVGLAGSLAGSLAGALLASLVLQQAPPAAGDGPERGTAFSAAAVEWSEE